MRKQYHFSSIPHLPRHIFSFLLPGSLPSPLLIFFFYLSPCVCLCRTETGREWVFRGRQVPGSCSGLQQGHPTQPRELGVLEQPCHLSAEIGKLWSLHFGCDEGHRTQS